MVGLNPKVIYHLLNIDPQAKPVQQKQRALDTEKYVALKERVAKLKANNFIRGSV